MLQNKVRHSFRGKLTKLKSKFHNKPLSPKQVPKRGIMTLHRADIKVTLLFCIVYILLWQVMNDEAGYVMFRGKQHTVITYSPETKIWTMRVVNNPSVYGTSTTLFPYLLMNIWQSCGDFVNDKNEIQNLNIKNFGNRGEKYNILSQN